MRTEEIKRLWAIRRQAREKEELRQTKRRANRAARRAQKKLAKIVEARKRTLHFRWKLTGKGGKLKFRLYLCYGGCTIAAWPTAEDPLLPLVQAKMVSKSDSDWKFLSRDQRKVMAMVRRLRKALVALEHGPRGKSISRQRRNLDKYCKFILFRVSL